ncbi:MULTISPECIES: glycine zipper domain-containing protein [Rhizobium]|uniref:glycine zipper domain-containing protein n=1 Tax=Rhizobium TaxID=379 RepID=UPI0003A3173B|nr:glycine zipper domain-containing protein [Rhizobium freirei]
MKKILMLALVGLSIASCTPTEQGAGIGAASGAIIGGAVTGNVRGAAVGAAIGGVSGAVIGSVQEQPGQCYYRDRYGRRYIDDCPRGGYRGGYGGGYGGY